MTKRRNRETGLLIQALCGPWSHSGSLTVSNTDRAWNKVEEFTRRPGSGAEPFQVHRFHPSSLRHAAEPENRKPHLEEQAFLERPAGSHGCTGIICSSNQGNQRQIGLQGSHA